MPPDSEGFPRRLDALMKAQGLSTRQIAERAGVSHSAVAQWLDGTNRATFEKAKIVAEVLEWDPMELFYGIPPADSVDRLVEAEGTIRRLRKALEALVMDAFAAGVLEPKAVAKLAGAKPLPGRQDGEGD